MRIGVEIANLEVNVEDQVDIVIERIDYDQIVMNI